MSNPFPTPECAPEAHVWGGWMSQALQGVPYRHRWCDVCGAMEFDQPTVDVAVQMAAAEVVDSAEGAS